MPQLLPYPPVNCYCQAFPQTNPLPRAPFPPPGSQKKSVSYYTFTLQFKLLQKIPHQPTCSPSPFLTKVLMNRFWMCIFQFNLTLFHWFVHFNNNNCWILITSEALLGTGVTRENKSDPVPVVPVLMLIRSGYEVSGY